MQSNLRYQTHWQCPRQLTLAEARSAVRDEMIHVAYSQIDQGAYGYGVSGCSRWSRTSIMCVGYFDADGHIRCTQRYKAVRDGRDGVGATYVANSTHCARDDRARF